MQLIEAISEQLAKVGIRAVPQAVPWETLRYDMLNLRRFDAVLLGFQFLPPDPDPYPYWHSSQANEFGVNLANYNDPRVDMLLEEARLTSDKGLRYELYQEFQQLFSEQVPSLLLYQPVYAYAVSDTVHDYNRPDDQLLRPLPVGADWYRHPAPGRWRDQEKGPTTLSGPPRRTK